MIEIVDPEVTLGADLGVDFRILGINTVRRSILKPGTWLEAIIK
jgi:hypothetical protein